MIRQFISKILKKISISVLSTSNVSTPRIQSYIILLPIIISNLIFLCIELIDFIVCLKKGEKYLISNEIIVIYGMLLSHHLALIFSRKKSQSIDEIKTNTKEEKEKEKEE